MKRTVTGVVLGALALLVAGPGIAADTAPIEIPALYPMSGPAAFIGQGQSKTLEIIQQMVNAKGGIQGHPIHFSIQDEAGNPATAVQLRERNHRQEAGAVHGTGANGGMRGGTPAGEERTGRLLYVAGNRAAGGQLRLFGRHGRPRSGQALRTLLPPSRVEPHRDDHRDRRHRTLFERSFNDAIALPENAGVEAVDREHFNSTDLSVVAQMSHIKSSNAQVLIAWTAGAGFGTVLHGIQDAGVTLPIGGGGANMTYSQMEQFKDVLPKERTSHR